jgi:hypothetical protein
LTFSTIIRSTAVAIGSAAILAQAALAGGEPKNEWPFTRPVGDRTPQAVSETKQQQAGPAIQGEPKNEPPFTRPATVVVSSGSVGFDWTSGGIGAAAGLGAALAGTGALLVARRSPRTA